MLAEVLDSHKKLKGDAINLVSPFFVLEIRELLTSHLVTQVQRLSNFLFYKFITKKETFDNSIRNIIKKENYG